MSEIEGYIDYLRKVRLEMRELFLRYPEEALNWRPLPGDTNSMYVLMYHLSWSEPSWIQERIGGRDIGRDRPSEFRVEGHDRQALLARIDAVAAESEKFLRSLRPEALDEERVLFRDAAGNGTRRTVRWCILRLTEHWIEHRAHGELNLQVWEHLKADLRNGGVSRR